MPLVILIILMGPQPEGPVKKKNFKKREEENKETRKGKSVLEGHREI